MNTVNKPARGAFTNEPVLNRGHPITTSLISSSITKELKLKRKVKFLLLKFPRNWINVRPKDVFLIILLSEKIFSNPTLPTFTPFPDCSDKMDRIINQVSRSNFYLEIKTSIKRRFKERSKRFARDREGAAPPLKLKKRKSNGDVKEPWILPEVLRAQDRPLSNFQRVESCASQ